MNSLNFVGIGEVLYDVFEDGTETLGGAPLNFAVHVHQLATGLGVGQGIIVSCINNDDRGNRVLNELGRLGMSTRYLAKDPQHPTGLVSVFMRNGEPGYQIASESAWDYIADQPEFAELARSCVGICFGTLAQRAPVSRATIRNFLQNAQQAIRLYDINLRRNILTGKPEYTPDIIEYSCQQATVIKANQAELFSVLELLGMGHPAGEDPDTIQRALELLLSRFPAQMGVVTRGARGTIVLSRNGEFHLNTPLVNKEKAHPVGAGDACAAGIVFGLALGWDIEPTMELANRMGSDVAAQPSATAPLSDSTLQFARTQLRRKYSEKNQENAS